MIVLSMPRKTGRCGRPLQSYKTGDNGIEPFMKRAPPRPNANWAGVKGFNGVRRDGD